jgi:lipopolysaccharide/colanic/teichoic acid biosynthesis glycosyltransferase
MSIDPKLREELMQRLSERNIKRRRWHYYRKMIMWDVMLGFSLGLKRLLDILGSLAGIILLLPLFIFTALAIVVENPGPVFYSQTRVGHNGREFPFFKFRSMVVGADKMKDQLLEQNESGAGVIFKMKKDPRITRVGSFIRRFSIDELPQLLNVLKGDMSLVGPRPPIPREVAEYTLEDRKRLHIKPGITCIWQVSGRSDIPFDQQVELDKQYILSKSLFTDIKILVLTVPAVLTGKGAY